MEFSSGYEGVILLVMMVGFWIAFVGQRSLVNLPRWRVEVPRIGGDSVHSCDGKIPIANSIAQFSIRYDCCFRHIDPHTKCTTAIIIPQGNSVGVLHIAF